MMSRMDWLRDHWKAIAAVGCGVGASSLIDTSPMTAVGLSAACGALGVAWSKEWQAGAMLGRFIRIVRDRGKLP